MIAAVGVGAVEDLLPDPDGIAIDPVMMMMRTVVLGPAEEDLEMLAMMGVDPFGDPHEVPEHVVHVLADLLVHLPGRGQARLRRPGREGERPNSRRDRGERADLRHRKQGTAATVERGSDS